MPMEVGDYSCILRDHFGGLAVRVGWVDYVERGSVWEI
jgi:hypothetical protein